MSKEIAVGMLKIAKNGNDLLQILDAIESSDCAADDGRGQDSAFMDDAFGGWYDSLKVTVRKGYFCPFFAQIYKDYAFFMLKKVL